MIPYTVQIYLNGIHLHCADLFEYDTFTPCESGHVIHLHRESIVIVYVYTVNLSEMDTFTSLI